MKPAEVLAHDQRKCFGFAQVNLFNVNLRGTRFSTSTRTGRVTPLATSPSPRALTSLLLLWFGDPSHCSPSMVRRKLIREPPPSKAAQSLALPQVTKSSELCRYQWLAKGRPGGFFGRGPRAYATRAETALASSLLPIAFLITAMVGASD